MKQLAIIFSIIILSGCSAQWHLKRAIKKDPALLTERVIKITDTVRLDAVSVTDTFVLRDVDTIEVVKDRFRVKITRSFDTIRVEGGCDSIVVYREIEVPVKVVEYKERNAWYHKMYEASFYILILGLILFILARKLKDL
jgi:hypothetical protein